MIPILLKMHPGYGLGDNVAFSIVLKHLRKYRPDWRIDYITDKGRHTAAIGLCHRVWHYDQAEALPYYSREINVTLHDNISNWTDRPNTPAIACLHEKFGIAYDPELGRYECNVSTQAATLAATWLASVGVPCVRGQYRAVAVHAHGKSRPKEKDLTFEELVQVCEVIRSHGRMPVLMDWERRYDVETTNRLTAANPAMCPQMHGGDAETNAAIIAQCEAFIGIDSGPGKLASTTETPSLIVWKGHHPLNYHDPAPNTTHLMPATHPVSEYFGKAYKWDSYCSGELVSIVADWLTKTLKKQ